MNSNSSASSNPVPSTVSASVAERANDVHRRLNAVIDRLEQTLGRMAGFGPEEGTDTAAAPSRPDGVIYYTGAVLTEVENQLDAVFHLLDRLDTLA